MRFTGLQKSLFITLVSLFVIVSLPRDLYAHGETLEPAELTGESAILIDAASGMVLFEKNADRQMYPASITKIITAIVALETAQLDEIVTVSKEARYEDGTRVYLAEGEQVTMEKLLYGLLVNSGNDAATAIAEHIDGSKEQFAERMNDFVTSKIGVTNTISKNPSGLPDPEHVTTARDMSKIAQYAMQNSMFRKIVSTWKMPWKGEEWDTTLINHNQLLGYYEGTTGIKNGYTSDAGSTLVASAMRNGMELIGVVLKTNSTKNLYQDMTSLLDYGFQNFEKKTVFTADQSYTLQELDSVKRFIARDPVQAVVPLGSSPAITVNPNGEVLVQSPLGQQTIGKLNQIPVVSVNEKSTPDMNQTKTPPRRSVFENIMLGLWLTLNIFMIIIGSLYYRKRKRTVREQGRFY